MIKLAFIEDDPLFLDNVRLAINRVPDIVLIYSAQSIAEFWANLPPLLSFDILFLDINLPGESGLAGLPKLRKKFPKTEIVMFSALDEPHLLFRALRLGANGYLLKGFKLQELITHIRHFSRGGAFLCPKMARYLVEKVSYATPSTDLNLTDKEKQVLQLFSEGYSYADAAAALNLSVDGLRGRVKRIYQKLNVSSKVEAVQIFNNNKLQS